MGRNGWVAASENFEDETFHGVGIECVSEGHHLVKDTSQTPDVGLLIIGLFLANFRREIIRCSYCSLCAVVCMLQHSGYSEIPYLYLP